MDLHTVTDLVPLASDAALPAWRDGDAWLAGGTWLFSEPQVGLARLLDLTTLGWPSLQVRADGLEIAATCTVAELAAWRAPASWPAAALVPLCCDAFVASFKVRGVATVGGNIVTALPAGPMVSLCAAPDGVATVWSADGTSRALPVASLVTGAGTTSLGPGELLRSVLLPDHALRGSVAFRRASLTAHGRTAALLVGRVPEGGGPMTLTVTGSVVAPVVLVVPVGTTHDGLAALLDEALAATPWQRDVHGSVPWRRAQTYRLAGEILAELLDDPA